MRLSTGTSPGRVALLAPMPSELAPLRAALGLVRSREPGPELFLGRRGGIELVAARTGIGMRAAARATARILGACSPDHLLVVGIAGAVAADVGVGDLVAPERVVNLETNASFAPAPMDDRPTRGWLACSDALIEPDAARELARRGCVAIDMETAAIAAVCESAGCPWSVFRAISDRADDGTTDAAVLGLVGPDGSPDLAAAARFVLTRPWRIPQLVRLSQGSRRAARAAARAAVAALDRQADARAPSRNLAGD